MERADMIGISENEVLAFCAALRMDIVTIATRLLTGGVQERLFRTPARGPGPGTCELPLAHIV